MARHSYTCIDSHTCGNPVRVVVEGGPKLSGQNMIERREHFIREYDWIRTGLMYEPRGHDLMSGSFLFDSTRDDCDVAVLFIETSGCLPMCGHGAIGTVTTMIEQSLVTPETPGLVRLDTPAGRVDAHYTQKGKRVSAVKLFNVPSYLAAENCEVECPDLGRIILDVGYGGNFYAIVDRQENFRDIADHTASDFIRWSRAIRKQLNEKYEFIHPLHPEISGCSHLLWTGDPINPEADSRNVVFYGTGAIDRSPCGTGTSSRMAQWAAHGKLNVGDTFIHESIIGSLFTGRVESETTVGDKPAIIPSIEGWARITGFNTILIDDDDPYAHGFQVI